MNGRGNSSVIWMVRTLVAATIGWSLDTSADELSPTERRQSSETALRLEHEYEFTSQLTTLLKQRRWEALITLGKHALTTEFATPLDPANRYQEGEFYRQVPGKHLVGEENSRCLFLINTHWYLAIAHLEVGAYAKAVEHLQRATEADRLMANAPVNGADGVRTTDFDLAISAEHRYRHLLRFGLTEQYLECIRPYIALLEKNSERKHDRAAFDCLSVIRLAEGNWQEGESLLQQAYQAYYRDAAGQQWRMFRDFNCSTDSRCLLPIIAGGRPGEIARFCPYIKSGQFGGLELADFMRSGSDYLDHPPRFLDKSIASLALLDPTLVKPIFELVVAQKQRKARGVQQYAAWIHRESNELTWRQSISKLGQSAATSLIARPQSALMAANNEAAGLLESHSDWSQIIDPGTISSDYHLEDAPSVKQIQQVLSSDAAVLECTVTTPLDVDHLEKGLRWNPPRYVAWLVRAKQPPRVIDIGDQQEIDKLIVQLQAFVGSPPPSSSAGDAQETCAAGEKLARRILGPIAKELNGVTKLTILPDGALWLVPWGALPISANKFLVETCDITLDFNASSLLEDVRKERLRAEWQIRRDQAQLRMDLGHDERQLEEYIKEEKLSPQLEGILRAGLRGESKQRAEHRRSLEAKGFSLAEVEAQMEVYNFGEKDFEDHPSTSAVIFADADYNAKPATILAAESKYFSPHENVDDAIVPLYNGKSILPRVPLLPGTAKEASAVAQALTATSSDAPKLFLQAAALESVARGLKSPETLVFSTHGFFLSPYRATGGVAPPKLPADNDAKPAVAVFRSNSWSELPPGFRPLDLLDIPYIRCGLLLAGANGSDQWGEVRSADGILTGLEASMLDLRGTKLVVLSACETAVGDPTIGEGVAGLRQAFHMAGAHSVLATLWQIPDQETAELISDFFTGLKENPSRAASLRNAQLKQIAQRRKDLGAAHPFFWAAFTLTGQ